MGALIGTGLVATGVTWAGKKALSAAFSKAQSTATQKFTEVAKTKAGDVLFGQKLNGPGELDDSVDFRGHTRYKAPKPGRLVKIFCGGSVIEANDLDAKLKDQAETAWKQQNAFEQTVLEPGAPVEGDGAEPKPEVGPDPKDAKVEEPVNKPITLDDFKTMVNQTEGAKNKGYVRFVKCDGGNGVTLAKVGNHVDMFMSWRVNVTAEHNRQMRQLLAETILSDFGGMDGLSVDPTAQSKFGPVLDKKLADLRTSILNHQNAGDLLKRTEVRDALKTYQALFEAESKQKIINSFLSECLRQCGYEGPHGGDVIPNVKAFLGEYGSVVGVKDLNDLIAAAKAATNGAALRAALESITLAFAKMNEVWQQDKQAMIFLQSLATSKTSAVAPDQGENLDKLRGAVLRRIPKEEWPVVPGKTLSVADTVNQFFGEGKVFDTLVRRFRKEYFEATQNGVPESVAGVNLRGKLSLASIVSEVRIYGNHLNTKLAEQKDLTAVQVIQDAKVAELKGYEDERRAKSSCLGHEAELEELDKKIAKVNEELEWLYKQEKLLKQDEPTKKVEDLLAEKDIGATEEKLQTWSKDALSAVLKEGFRALDQDFQIDYITQNFLNEKYPGFDNGVKTHVREIMQKIVDNFMLVATKALTATVKDANDISLGELIEDFGDFLMSDILEDGLKNDEVEVTDRNPFRALRNTRRTSPQIFVEGVMRVSVEHALAQKLDKGVSFAEVEGKLKARAAVVGKKLAKLFAAIAGKDSKLKGFRSYVADTRVFQQTGVIDAKQWETEKAKYRDGARHLLRITLLAPFLDEDLPALLEEGDADFEAKAQARLDWRVRELMVAFKAMNVQQFYEGALHFDTLKALGDNSMHVLFGLPVKDAETGFTDPQRVGEVFRNTLEVVNKSRRDVLQKADRPAFVLQDVELGPLFRDEAEKAWRQDIVAHAPGAYKFHIINTILAKIQDFLNVPVENRQTNINGEWLDKRRVAFEATMGRFTRDYLAFEKRVTKLCRAEMAKILAAVGGETFNGVHDAAIRARLVDDVLGGFKASIGELLTRYLAHPEAMTEYVKGGNDRLAGLVREALGLGKDPDAAIAKTAGAKRAASALALVVRNHADIVNDFTASKLLQNDMVDKLLKSNLADGNNQVADLEALANVVTWAVNHTLEYARKNPVETYSEDLATFEAALIDRAQKDLRTVAQPFAGEIVSFGQKLAAAFQARQEKLQASPALETYAQNAQAEMRAAFTNAFCNLAVSRAKDGKAYKANLAQLVAESVKTYEDRLDQALRLSADRQVAAFTTLSQAFDGARRKAEAALTLPGVSMESLVLLRKKCDEAWSDVNAKFGEKMTSVTIAEKEIDDALYAAKDELESQIEAIAADFTARLEKSGSILTEKSLAATLEGFGVTLAAFPNEETYDAALAFLLNDSSLVGFFNGMQEMALKADSDGVPSVTGSGSWEKSFVPGFKTFYRLAENKLRLRAQREAIDDGVLRLTLGKALEDREIEAIQAAAMDTITAAVDKVFKVEVTDVQTIDQAVDLAQVEATSIDVPTALAAAQTKMDGIFFVREVAPSVLDAVCARQAGLTAPEGASERVRKAVEANRHSFENALKDWLRKLVAMGTPETWRAELAEVFGDPQGSRVPASLAVLLEGFNDNLQAILRQEGNEKSIDLTIRNVRKTAIKRLFALRLATGAFESADKVGVKRYERFASRIPKLGPVAAVEVYLAQPNLAAKQRAAAEKARAWALAFEARLTAELDDLRAQLLKGVGNGELTQLPDAQSAYALADRTAEAMKKEAGNAEFASLLGILNDEYKKTEK